MGHPEAGFDRICRPLCWDLQRRQQAQALHCHRHDWLSCAGAAGKLANNDELMSTLFGCLGFMQGFINEMVYGSRWEAIWVQSGLASNVLYIGKKLCSSIQAGINLRSLPYADRDEDLYGIRCSGLFICLFVPLCACSGRAHDGDGPALSPLPVERHHECHSGRQGGGVNVTQVLLMTMNALHTCTQLTDSERKSWPHSPDVTTEIL